MFLKTLRNKTSYSHTHTHKKLSCGNLFKVRKSHACLTFPHYRADVFLLPPTLWTVCKPVFFHHIQDTMIQNLYEAYSITTAYSLRDIFTAKQTCKTRWISFCQVGFFYSGASKCVVSTLNSKNVLYKAQTLLIFYFLAFPPFKTVCGPLVLYFITAIGAKIMNCCKTD